MLKKEWLEFFPPFSLHSTPCFISKIQHFIRSPLAIAWLLITAITLIDLTWIAFSSKELKIGFDMLYIFSTAVALLACLPYTQNASIVTLIHSAAFTLISAPVLGLFNVLTSSLSGAMCDDFLSRIDKALGLPWADYAIWVNDRPVLISLLEFSYNYLELFSILILIVGILMYGRKMAEEFLLLLTGTLVLVSIIGAFVPAWGAMIYFDDLTSSLTNIREFARLHVPFFKTLQTQGISTIVLGKNPGLTTFPSFHTASGLILVYVARGHRGLLALVSVYSAVMLASTPIIGGHYFIDMIAGAALTLMVIMAVRALWPAPQNLSSSFEPATARLC